MKAKPRQHQSGGPAHIFTAGYSGLQEQVTWISLTSDALVLNARLREALRWSTALLSDANVGGGDLI